MSTIPSILESATNLFHAGFKQLDKAAQEVAAGSLQLNDATQSGYSPATINQTSPQIDSSSQPDLLTQGLLDTISAQLQVSYAAVLVRAYDRTTNDLTHLLDPASHN